MADVVPFDGTNWTHEVVIDGETRAYATSLDEAKIVARALSRVTRATTEVRVYAAYTQLPTVSFRRGSQVR
jgi:hypothetical protein